ncbi:MAG: hypothetical protein ACM31C_09800 [Acidobacteriota bacterium]
MRSLVVVLSLAACTADAPSRPPPLAPLPPPASVETSRFRDADACAQCHLVDDTTSVLHDATGTNVSPVLLWRSSLMALAARDPYYLAVFSEELAAAPSHAPTIEPTCTRCHAPAGSEELAENSAHLTFADLTTSTDPAPLLGRGGVTCTLCHQIDPANLGQDASFTGGFTVGYGRTVYGRYGNPVTNPMQLIVNYTPALGTHIASSALCATCHTVIVPVGATQVVEQATFLEWRASAFPGQSKPCQTCHVPTNDAANNAISTIVANFSTAALSPRMPVGEHVFVGGNSYVLSLLADAPDWSNANVPAAELMASAARDDAHLATAAKLQVVSTSRDPDGTLVLVVRVINQTGHKLPTGYPSRRVWLHVTAGSFESGRADTLVAQQPHRDVITSGDQAQIWEAVLVDASGVPTHRTLDAHGYGKDDRILPAGFAPTGTDVTRTAPVGVAGDASFVAGQDDVTYRISGVSAGTPIAIELLYEAVRPDIVDAIDAAATPAGTRFADLAHARPVTPVVLATASATAP